MILLSAIDHEDGNNGPSDIAKSVRHEVEAELSIEDQELLIFAAAWCGRFEVVARYLNIWPSAGYWRWSVDPTKVVTSSRNRYYGTPLQAAILQEDIAMVELLLPSIGVYSIDDHGWSAMQCASFCSTNEIPELLVYVLEKLQGSNLPMENQGNAATMKSPSMWSTIHMSTHIEVDKSGLEARCISSTSFRYEGKYRHPIVQADHSFAKDAPVYFEVEILALADSGSSIAIGITKGIHPLNQLIGFQLDTYTGIRSWGYHCNNCVAVYNANPELIYFDGRHDATISKGDILGCGVTKSKEFFVTRNGVKYVTNFGGIQGQLFPVANVLSGGHIRANFGPTFKYDIYSDPDICTGNESGSSNGGSAATSVRGSAT
ncbi:hypothetical protein DFH27DRAFT_216695 [Peziza echinospora]|nr:hypothetical protein DFH27DRAFT_216695 [Peziza echinospora]